MSTQANANKELGKDNILNAITKFIVLAVVGAAVLSAADLAAGENVPGIVNDGGRWSRDVDGKEMVCFPNTVLKVGDTFYCLEPLGIGILRSSGLA